MPDKKPKIRGNDPRLSQPKLRGDCRPIHLPSGIWQWKTDGWDVVVLYRPDGQRITFPFWEVVGMTKEQCDDWRNDLDMESRVPITPSEVRAFILGL